jgi:hypothetical protein
MWRFLITTITVLFCGPAALAQDSAGCDKFAWSLARERGWLTAAEKANITTGDTLKVLPTGAIVIALVPLNEVKFSLPPERKARTENGFGGAIAFPAPQQSGILQVALSEEAWIDIVQGGRYARSVGNTGRSDCPGVRKSVRFEVGNTPFVLQLSGAASNSIIATVGPAPSLN